jgi:hypothetical protein
VDFSLSQGEEPVDGFKNQPNATPNLSCQGKGKKRSEADGQAVRLIYQKARLLTTWRSAASPRSDGGLWGCPIGRPIGLPWPPRSGSWEGHVGSKFNLVFFVNFFKTYNFFSITPYWIFNTLWYIKLKTKNITSKAPN